MHNSGGWPHRESIYRVAKGGGDLLCPLHRAEVLYGWVNAGGIGEIPY